ncbi:MAG: hypothetical protein RSE13_17205 [Planktothrix sp. GU0601_MAG3]|nr:MAG: hypothetical protein RSE13_17205 [Planktothrix sp. GU0601_MAG3]
MKILSQTPRKKLLPLLLGIIASVAIFFLVARLYLHQQFQLQQSISTEANGIELQLSKETHHPDIDPTANGESLAGQWR